MTERETLFEYPDHDTSDLEVWENKYGHGNAIGFDYGIGIEGYIGFESIADAIEYYTKLLHVYKTWLSEQHIAKPKTEIRVLYRTRDISIERWGEVDDLYWICTYAPSFSNLWGCYGWLNDIINQLKTADKNVAVGEKQNVG